MKKITLLCLAFIAFAFSFQANAQCDYTIELTDSWGDGWNGVSSVDVFVNGTPVLTGLQAAAGAGGGVATMENVAIPGVLDGDDITVVFNPAATAGAPDYAAECSYRILNNVDTEVGAGDSLNDITTGTVIVACATCTPATVSIPVDPIDDANCPATVDVSIDIEALGDSAMLTISAEDDMAMPAGTGGTVSATGIFTITDIPVPQTSWSIIIAHETDPGCNVVLGPFLLDCPIVNDDCSGAIALSCDDVVAYDTTVATLDAGNDVTCGTVALSPDVWYTYVGDGSTSETITLSTCNDADYDTKIFVYSGTCGALVCVANNDDGPGCAGFSSQLDFVSDGSTTYYISVNGYTDGAGVSTGTGNLTITCEEITVPAPANDDCGGAFPLAYGVAQTGDTTNATNAIANPSCDTFGTITDLWYSFVGPMTGEVTLTATLGTSDNAWIAVYDSCGGAELGCASGATVGGGTGSDGTPGGKQLELTGLASGTTYFVQVWNDGAALRESGERLEGTFDIMVEEGLLSTQDFDNDLGFTYYPNPVNDNLSLNAQNNIDDISVYNMLGQEVLRATPNTVNTEVNMSELQSGAYFVKVTIEGITETVRIIKN